MSLSLAIAIYFVCWWITLFAILPIGVRTQDEEGEVVPGTPGSAPIAPRMLWKVVVTTLVAGIAWAVIYVVVAFKLISLDAIPL